MDKYTIGIFNDRSELKRAIEELQDLSFPKQQITVIEQNSFPEMKPEGAITSSKTQQYGKNYAGEGTRSGAVSGSVIGSILGLLVGSGLIAIPFIGPIMLSEAVFTVLATMLAGSGIGIASGGICGHIVGWGIKKTVSSPQPTTARTDAVKTQKARYLLIIRGDERDIKDVNSILAFQHQYWSNYHPLSLDEFVRKNNYLTLQSN